MITQDAGTVISALNFADAESSFSLVGLQTYGRQSIKLTLHTHTHTCITYYSHIYICVCTYNGVAAYVTPVSASGRYLYPQGSDGVSVVYASNPRPLQFVYMPLPLV